MLEKVHYSGNGIQCDKPISGVVHGLNAQRKLNIDIFYVH